MPKKSKYESTIFEEPLIDINMLPTEERDPLFIDPTDESSMTADPPSEDCEVTDFDIFSPLKPQADLPPEKAPIPTISGPEGVTVKQEADGSGVYIKEEPNENYHSDTEKEVSRMEILARALTTVKYLCPKCTFRSTDKEEVNLHHLSSHRVCISRPRPCDKCDFVAKTVRELSHHKKINHPRVIVDNIPTLPTGEFKCPHCDFISFHKSNIRTHTKIHTQEIIYTCDKCPYSAISKLNMENHASRHLHKSKKKWKFKCPHCGLLERTEKLLARHLILHGEGEMISCGLCPYKSPYMHIISQHSRICHGIISKRRWEKEESSLQRRLSGRQKKKCRYAEIDSDEEEYYQDVTTRITSLRKRTKKYDESNKLKQLLTDGKLQQTDSMDLETYENNLPSNNNTKEKDAENTTDTALPCQVNINETQVATNTDNNSSNEVVNKKSDELVNKQSNKLDGNQSNELDDKESNELIVDQSDEIDDVQSNERIDNQSNELSEDQSNESISNQTNESNDNQTNKPGSKKSNELLNNQLNKFINKLSDELVDKQSDKLFDNLSNDFIDSQSNKIDKLDDKHSNETNEEQSNVNDNLERNYSELNYNKKTIGRRRGSENLSEIHEKIEEKINSENESDDGNSNSETYSAEDKSVNSESSDSSCTETGESTITDPNSQDNCTTNPKITIRSEKELTDHSIKDSSVKLNNSNLNGACEYISSESDSQDNQEGSILKRHLLEEKMKSGNISLENVIRSRLSNLKPVSKNKEDLSATESENSCGESMCSETDELSTPAVLVLKRAGNSFKCFAKINRGPEDEPNPGLPL